MNKHILFFKKRRFFRHRRRFYFFAVLVFRVLLSYVCIFYLYMNECYPAAAAAAVIAVVRLCIEYYVTSSCCMWLHIFFFGLKWYSMLCKFCFCYWIHILLLLPLRFCLNRETSIAIHPLCICVIEWAICSIDEKKELRTRINKKIEINREKKEWIDKILQFKQRHHKQKVKRGKIGLCFFCFNVIKFCLCQRQYNPIEKRIQKKTVES